jgi:hypothetical protein
MMAEFLKTMAKHGFRLPCREKLAIKGPGC